MSKVEKEREKEIEIKGSCEKEPKQKMEEERMEELFEKQKEPLEHRPMFAEHQKSKPSEANFTPLTLKTKDVQWINAKIAEMAEPKIDQLRSVFESAGLLAYEQAETLCLGLLDQLLSMTTSVESIAESRKKKIWAFAQRVLLGLALDPHNPVDNSALLADPVYLRAVLCVSTYLYLFTNSLPMAQIKGVCKVFECSYQSVVYHMGQIVRSTLGIPPGLRQHLADVETAILLRYAWEDEVACALLQGCAKDVACSFFVERLHEAIHQRIGDLAKDRRKLLAPTKELTLWILMEKPHFLAGNFIDQIILCALYYVASLNPEESDLSFEQIFQSYSRLPNSFQEYKNRVVVKGECYALFDFHQLLFAPAASQFEIPKEPEAEPSSPTFRRQMSFGFAETPPMTQSKSFKKSRLDALKSKSRRAEDREKPEAQEEGSNGFQLARTFSFSMDENSMTFGMHTKRNDGS